MRYYACPLRTWEIATARPHPRLRRAIYAYRGFRMDIRRPRRMLGIPGSAVTLMLGFDSEQPLQCRPATGHAIGTSFASVLAGLGTRSRVFERRGRTHGIEVAFAPWAAFTALGLDMHDLTDTVVEPSTVLGSRADRLADTLAALPDWQQRFDLLDAVLSRWLARGRAWSPRVEWAYDELARTGGRFPIEKLAEHTGRTQRQLQYRFREQIGMPPKAVARVFRLRHALRRLTDGCTAVQTAADCGFSDQAHLTREVRAMTGFTPKELRIQDPAYASAIASSERAVGQIRSIPLGPEALLLGKE